ncbi:MAG: hypothetical protein JNN30_04240 [Rhodanobacteraceae bacterium]|nr:hypothetical protein [Rhodanobacteraceae bacterium]
MITIVIPFMVLAGLGLLISVTFHVFALVGRVPLGGNVFMAMNFGIFAIWLPAAFVFQRIGRDPSGRPSWKQALAGCPRWMRYAMFGLLGYAFLNFLLCTAAGTAPHHSAGDPVSPGSLRLFSGHWMAFYGIGFAILFSVVRDRSLLAAANCPSGHPVNPSASFCPACGVPLVRTKADISKPG